MKHLYLYFSGTGNTRHAVYEFSSKFENDNDYHIQSIEYDDFEYDKAIKEAEIIIIAYPIHDSMLPYIMKDFLYKYMSSFKNKKIMTIATQLAFSGDGGALPYYILKKVNVKHLHSIHINMPNNLSDVPFFKMKTLDESKAFINKSNYKINEIVTRIQSGKTIRMGRKWYSWFLGFFTQRLWGILFIKSFRSKVKIDFDKCIHCNKCVKHCPTKNLTLVEGTIKIDKICTLCYRCINLCPTQAISLLLKSKPKKQYIQKDFN